MQIDENIYRRRLKPIISPRDIPPPEGTSSDEQ